MSTFVRCALVPAEGRPILFEHANSMHRSRLVVEDVRPMHAWEFYDDPAAEAAIWAREIVEAMRELGVGGEPLAVDRLGTPGFLALQHEGVTFIDSAPVTQAAREVKTPEEIRLFEINGAMVVDMLTAFEEALVPGVRERDLLAVLSDTMLREGGEYLATSTVCSGPNTNPWRSEATDRVIEPGTWSTSTPTRSGSRATSSACRGRSSAETTRRPPRSATRTGRRSTGWRG